MAKTGAERVRAHRARRKKEKEGRHRILDDLHPYIAERLNKEMQFSFRINEKLDYVLDWTFSDEIAAFLGEYARSRGVDYCDMMNDLSDAIVERATGKGG